MTKVEFKIWLLKNNYTQASLADKLGLGVSTISKYNKERYPVLFIYALKGLESESINKE